MDPDHRQHSELAMMYSKTQQRGDHAQEVVWYFKAVLETSVPWRCRILQARNIRPGARSRTRSQNIAEVRQRRQKLDGLQ